MSNVIKRVRQVTKNAAAKAVGAIPSPGSPTAAQGEDCGCGRRKARLQENLRGDKSLTDIIGDLVDDLRGKKD